MYLCMFCIATSSQPTLAQIRLGDFALNNDLLNGQVEIVRALNEKTSSVSPPKKVNGGPSAGQTGWSKFLDNLLDRNKLLFGQNLETYRVLLKNEIYSSFVLLEDKECISAWSGEFRPSLPIYIKMPRSICASFQ